MENPLAVLSSFDLNLIHILFERDVNAIGRSFVSQASYDVTEDGFSAKTNIIKMEKGKIDIFRRMLYFMVITSRI